MNAYNDIAGAARPFYRDRSTMSRHDRAAQFSPFAALTGYEEAVQETARLTDQRIELTEDAAAELNFRLNALLEKLSQRPEIGVTYFVPDQRKQGGKYLYRTGRVRTFDHYENALVFADGTRVSAAEIISINDNLSS